MDNLGSARAGQPDVPVVSIAVQITAALMLSDKGHQGIQHVRHRPL